MKKVKLGVGLGCLFLYHIYIAHSNFVMFVVTTVKC